MKAAPHDVVSERDYLERERRSDVKHELINGRMIAMAGGSIEHALIIANVIGALGRRLAGGPCVVFSSELRVNVAATRLYTYPDVTVVCGPIERHPEDGGTIRNPTLLVEVLSESTEGYDRGAKFAHYRNLPSLREYLLVHQGERRVERYERVDVGSWLLTDFIGEAALPLPALGVELPLAEVYANLERVVEKASPAG